MSSELAPFLLLDSEIEAIYDTDQYFQFIFDVDAGKAIKTKVISFKPEINHKINCNTYDTIFVTSDTHSDLRKFVQILINNKLIETSIDPYNGDDIYDPKLITETNWIGGPRVLLIIIGDIVDGKRIRRLDDNRGSFEYLLHCFLYNIRIKAMMSDSNILFTMGNHDIESVIVASDFNKLYENYVTDDSKRFFLGTHADRRNALLPFYYKCPYLCLQLVNDSNVCEIICVHAGIRSSSGDSVLAQLNGVQDRLTSTPAKMPGIIQNSYSTISSSIWDRYYTVQPDTKKIGQEKDPLTIIGHCPTHNQDATTKHLTAGMTNPVYDGCQREPDCGKDRGCVFLSKGANDIPQFILVDTGLSEGFRYSTMDYMTGYCQNKPMFHNMVRNIEILKLSHDDSAPAPLYFNRIERQLNGVAYNFDSPISAQSSAPSPSAPASLPTPPPALPVTPPAPPPPDLPATEKKSSVQEVDDEYFASLGGGKRLKKNITTRRRNAKRSKKNGIKRNLSKKRKKHRR